MITLTTSLPDDVSASASARAPYPSTYAVTLANWRGAPSFRLAIRAQSEAPAIAHAEGAYECIRAIIRASRGVEDDESYLASDDRRARVRAARKSQGPRLPSKLIAWLQAGDQDSLADRVHAAVKQSQ